MIEAFNLVISKLSDLVKWFSDLFVALFVALWDLFKDVFSWGFEQILKIVVSAVSAIDLSGIDRYTNSAGSLPSELLNILGLLGVGTAVSIISSAIAIRLVLQLIPFTRLGS